MQPHALNWFELPALDLAPTANGPVLYLNTFGQMDEALARIEHAGGTIVAPKMALGQFGQAAVIVDSEGNKVGLHQS